MADAVIQAQDSRKLLHVNRSLMACHCTFFKDLFFSESPESKKSVLIVGIDFDILVEILKIIHQVNRNCEFVWKGTLALTHLCLVGVCGGKFQPADYVEMSYQRRAQFSAP